MSNRRQIDECNDPTVIIVPPEERPDLITIYGVVDLWLGQTDFDNYDPMVGVYALDSEGNDVAVICTLASQTADEKVYAYLASNATYTATATRHVYLWGAPTITAYDRTIYQGDRTFNPLENVTAVDIKGNPVPVTVSGYYDVDTPGTYNLIYIANSKGFSASVTKTLTVLPWEAPTLIVPPLTVIREGDPFDPMDGVSATDFEGTDITSSITYVGTWDVDVPGTYVIDYSVVDRLGRRATARQTLVVEPSLYQTVLFSDGTLIINEDKDNLQDDILIHGAVTKIYDPGPYDFHMWDRKPLWYNERGLILNAEFGSAFKPTSLRETFYECSNLETVNLTNLDTSECTDFASMFSNCYALKAIDGTKFDVSVATDLSRMFLDCWKLKYLDLTGWDTHNCTDFTSMFYDCVELRVIYASDNFVTPQDSFKTATMFSICQSLSGGMGTAYSSQYINYVRAYIDEWTDRPGYFTDKTKLVSTLYEDGTLIINEPYSDRQRNINLYGDVKLQFAPTTAENGWLHNWAGNTDIKEVYFATPTKPTTMAGWFDGCRNLEKIDWTNLDSSDCTNMSNLFGNCSSLTTCDLSALDTSNVTNFASIFRSMNPFTGFMDYVNNWDTSSGTNFAGMFMGIRGMVSITPKFDTSNATSMASMFAYMDVSEIDITYMDMTNVVDTPFMFGVNPSLNTIYSKEDFALNPNCNSVNMFANSPNIVGGLGTTVTLVDGTYAKVDGYNGTPGYFTFIRPLGTVLYTDGTLIINEKSSDRLANIARHGAVVKTYREAPYNLADQTQQPWQGERPSIKAVEFGDIVKPTRLAYWFSHLENCESYDLSKLDTSDCVNMQNLFARNRRLTSIDVTGFDTSKNKSIGYMFYDCTLLRDIDVSGWDMRNMEHCSGAFYNCDSLPSVDVSGWRMPKCEDTIYMFGNCGELTTLNCANFGLEACKDFIGMFMGCEKLTTLTILGWNTQSAVRMDQMFSRCRALRNLTVSHLKTSTVTQMNEMFYDCDTITSLNIRNFDYAVLWNAEKMFYGCDNLKTIYSKNFLSSVVITREMFTYCTNLVGGSGTRYNARYVDISRAKIDGGSSNPGYFTA